MKYIHWFLFSTLCGLFLFMFMDSLAYLFPYHEQQQLFLFTRSYLDVYLSEPGKVGQYIANFVIQFFYWPFAGKLLLALLLSGLYLLPSLTVRRLTGKSDPLHLALLPSLYLFIRFERPDFEISEIISLFIVFVCTRLLALLPRRFFYYALLPCLLACGFAFGWIGAIAAFIVLALAAFSAYMLSGGMNGKIYKYVTAVSLCLYASFTFHAFVKNYDMRERLLIEADHYTRRHEWKKVIVCAKRYRGESQLMDYFLNMALYHTGRMPYDLLDYRQSFGPGSLFLPWTGNPRLCKYGHYLYEQLGYINEAQHWAFEALVVYGETAPILSDLIRYNIVIGRPEVARRFIRVLKESLFYKGLAEEYEKMVPTGQVKGLNVIPFHEEGRARFIHMQDLTSELVFICDQDPSNRMAFEYLMSSLILSNNPKAFAENLPRIKSFSYPEMPSLYQRMLDRNKLMQP